jgi:16S rRNA (uracil1498-N3)-methyltransferase
VGKRVGLDEHENHHLKVRRAKDGEEVQVLDGSGLMGTGTLVQVGREWMVELGSAELQQPPLPLTLAVAAGDRERFSWMVEKAVELGVTRIVPLETKHTAAVATRLKPTHVERLRRAVLDAIKQCGAPWAPTLESPTSLVAFASEPLSGTGWLGDEAGAPVPALLDRGGVTVVVGPEGGLSEDEWKVLLQAGYQPMSLGQHTLRFETAALAAAAAVSQARLRGSSG